MLVRVQLPPFARKQNAVNMDFPVDGVFHILGRSDQAEIPYKTTWALY